MLPLRILSRRVEQWCRSGEVGVGGTLFREHALKTLANVRKHPFDIFSFNISFTLAMVNVTVQYLPPPCNLATFLQRFRGPCFGNVGV